MRSLLLITRSGLRLSRRDRLDVARAWLWLVAARTGVACLSYGSITRLVARIPVRQESRDATSPERCARAVRRASRFVGGSSCLTQAIAAQCLLRRDGWTSQIVFGVAQDSNGGLEAHAWLWNDGRIVVGGEPADRYIPLAAPRPS